MFASILDGLLLWLLPGSVYDPGNRAIVTEQYSSPLVSQILLNINVEGGLPGLAVASPSTSNPNYYYHWVRDGALTIAALIDEYEETGAEYLRDTIEDYIKYSAKLQKAVDSPDNPSGIGEPKFCISGDVFTGEWGRPQNDGAALRVLAACKWAHVAETNASNIYWSLVRDDTRYIQQVISHPSFDLWEERKGLHYFTGVVQWAALKAAAILAELCEETEDAIAFTASMRSLETMISAEPDFPGDLAPTVDSSVVLAALEINDLAQWTQAVDNLPLIVNVSSPVVIDTAQKIRNHGMLTFAINYGQYGGVGRYPGDIYDGYGQSQGNPWFLCTAALAEWCLRIGDFDCAAQHMTFIGDHRGHDGTISEQAHRDTGFMVGAQNLTWSYTSLLRAQKLAKTLGRPDIAQMSEAGGH